MPNDLQCVNAFSVRVDGETVAKRCTGSIVLSSDGGAYVCSSEGGAMRYEDDLVESYKASPLWHRTGAVEKLLALLTRFNPTAYNSTFPWIQIPFGEKDKALAETTTGTWAVNFYEDNLPHGTSPTDIPTDSEDCEAIARAISATLADLEAGPTAQE